MHALALLSVLRIIMYINYTNIVCMNNLKIVNLKRGVGIDHCHKK